MKNIRYCGNCNPDVDPGEVRKVVERVFGGTDPETTIMVNGCSRICLTKKRIKGSPDRVVDLCGRDVMEEYGTEIKDAPSRAGRSG